MTGVPGPIIGRIEEIANEVPGWAPVDQLYTLFGMIFFNPDVPGDIIEIGSWCGRSTAVLGLAAQLVGNARIYCVDLFPEKGDWYANPDGSYSFRVRIDGAEYEAYRDQTVWKEPFEKSIAPLYEKHDRILDVFMDTVDRMGLRDIVVPLRGTSDMLARALPAGFRSRLAFIDGDHGYEAVLRDIRNVEPLLADGGWLCFDDAFSGYDGVDRAIREAVFDNPGLEPGRRMTRKFFAARKKSRPGPRRPGGGR